MNDLKKLSYMELLGLHVEILEELRYRGVIRTMNNPTGDLAEFLFCQAFSWKLAPNSNKGFSATDSRGNRYQIKGRRPHQRNTSRQLSQMRNLESFDTLAAVLFDDKYAVKRAALIPGAVVHEQSKFVEHTNSYKFMLTDDVWDDEQVTDVTEKLRAVVAQEMVMGAS